MRSAKEIITKIQTLLNEAPTTESGIENTPERFANLTVNHVSYGYDEDKLVLSDISFTLERGGKYLLEGSSGSGKITLIKLLTDALSSDNGDICLDGVPIKQFKSEQYARFIIPCSQQTFIFNASIRDNVTLFCHEFTDEEIIDAITKSGFSEILTRYPDGIDHVID